MASSSRVRFRVERRVMDRKENNDEKEHGCVNWMPDDGGHVGMRVCAGRGLRDWIPYSGIAAVRHCAEYTWDIPALLRLVAMGAISGLADIPR